MVSDNLRLISSEESKVIIDLNSATIVFCPHKTGLLGVCKRPDAKSIEPIPGVFDLLKAGTRDTSKYKMGYYRGGESTDDQISNDMNEYQKQFKANKINVMVATKAFGMGFNKPNVRFCIHMNYPGSIESFAQETGRIGRDRKLALSYLLCSDIDEKVPSQLHKTNYPGIEKEVQLTRKILEFKNPDNKSINDRLRESNNTKDFVIEIDSGHNSFKVFQNHGQSDRSDTIFGKIIYRLALVGIIDDYTISYSQSAKFTLIIEPKTRKSLKKTLKLYLLRYFTEKQADIQVQQFFQDHAGNPSYSNLIEFYIKFEYDYIKTKRKQAIKDIDFACKYGLDNQETDRLSVNFREYIDVYFSSKYFRDNFKLPDGRDGSITKATDRGKVQDEGIIRNFIDIVKTDSGGIIPNCKELRGACIRLLNDNPNNFSLHILNSFTNMILSRKKLLEFNQGVKELITGAELYLKSKEELIEYTNFSELLGSFWKSIDDEDSEFGQFFKENTGYNYAELEKLMYLKRSAEILSGIIK